MNVCLIKVWSSKQLAKERLKKPRQSRPQHAEDKESLRCTSQCMFTARVGFQDERLTLQKLPHLSRNGRQECTICHDDNQNKALMAIGTGKRHHVTKALQRRPRRLVLQNAWGDEERTSTIALSFDKDTLDSIILVRPTRPTNHHVLPIHGPSLSGFQRSPIYGVPTQKWITCMSAHVSADLI